MLQAITSTILGSPKSPASPTVSQNVNMSRGNNNNTINRKNDEKSLQKLINEIKLKDSVIIALQSKLIRLEDERRKTIVQSNNNAYQLERNNNNDESNITRRKHPLIAVSHVINDDGREEVDLGTRGSMLTRNILEEIPENIKSSNQLLAEKFLQVFRNPVDFIPYLQSSVFANDLISVCQDISNILEEEPKCLYMQSPVYVFGDIHGNIEDLHFFSDNIWKLGIDLTAGSFLFLGDYVDRGMNGLEVVAYLFGLKLLYPRKIHLLRGNHETRDVNGWEDHYKEKSFLYQCKERFGVELGELVWEECNLAFDRLPVAGVIDQEIFCVHGGIPRPVDGYEKELDSVLALPGVIGIMPPYEDEEDWVKQVASDCIWSDPAPEAIERKLPSSGFGESPRGGGAVMFGSKAIDKFLSRNNLSYIIRAHEAHAHGVAISKGARVFTVFSTSKDHRQGSRAMAGCILIDVEQIQVINRSPKYKNKYVHRRTSVSLDCLSLDEIEDRSRLGFIRSSAPDEDYFRIKMDIENESKRNKELIAQINNVNTLNNDENVENRDAEEITNYKPKF